MGFLPQRLDVREAREPQLPQFFQVRNFFELSLRCKEEPGGKIRRVNKLREDISGGECADDRF